jgi:hypothetical protein
MTTQSISKSPLDEVKFLTESIAGIFFLILLVATMVLLAIGFSGIHTGVQILVPFMIGIVILALTITLRKDKKNKTLIYSIYPLLFIVCSSGSFNSIFSFFSKGSYYNVESAKWQENLTQLNAASNLIFDNLSNKDSVITVIRQQSRKLENEVRDNGFKSRADEYFMVLDKMLGGGKLKKPSNKSPELEAIEENIEIINQQVEAFIYDIESSLNKTAEKYRPKREQNEITIKKMLENLSRISKSQNPSELIQEAKNTHTQISTDIKTLTGINPIAGIPENRFETKELNNIMDTFSIVGNVSESRKYTSALLIALIFSLLIEGATLILSILISSTPDSATSNAISNFNSELLELKAKIERLEQNVLDLSNVKLESQKNNQSKVSDAIKRLDKLQEKIDEHNAEINAISNIRQSFTTNNKKKNTR